MTASTWTSGNAKANCSLWAVESEGVAGEPLNDNQVKNMLTLRDEFEAYTGRKLTRGEANTAGRTLWQHNEVWNWTTPNAGPTSCPSGRYQPFFEALEDNMADPRVDAIIAALGGQDAIDKWNENGNSLLLGYSLEQQKLADHLDHHPSEDAQAGTKVLPHKHSMGIAISETGGVA